MSTEVTVKGLDVIVAKLRFLSGEETRRPLRFGMRRAAQVIADLAAARARSLDDPETGRQIADNVTVRNGTKNAERKTGNLTSRVGVAGTAVLNDNPDLSKGAPTPHWRLLEFGTSTTPANPFMRPAMEQGMQGAFDEFARSADLAIDRALKRKAKALIRG
jgi:HK97 gp10 family phage protein